MPAGLVTPVGWQHLWAILLSLSDYEFALYVLYSLSLSLPVSPLRLSLSLSLSWLSGSAKKFIKNFCFDVSEFYFKVFSVFSADYHIYPAAWLHLCLCSPDLSPSIRFSLTRNYFLACNYGKFPRWISLWPDKSLMQNKFAQNNKNEIKIESENCWANKSLRRCQLNRKKLMNTHTHTYTHANLFS